MKRELWEIWLEDKNRRVKDLALYLKSKKIKVEKETKELIQGHLEKADHNLKFVKETLELKEYNDWAIVSAYYAIYHASLALCAFKGYSTKDHLATLLILINEFYPAGLDSEEIKIVNETTLEKEHVLYYVNAKAERGKASYSTKTIFNAEETEELRKKAIEFVNKAKNIIESAKR